DASTCAGALRARAPPVSRDPRLLYRARVGLTYRRDERGTAALEADGAQASRVEAAFRIPSAPPVGDLAWQRTPDPGARRDRIQKVGVDLTILRVPEVAGIWMRH